MLKPCLKHCLKHFQALSDKDLLYFFEFCFKHFKQLRKLNHAFKLVNFFFCLFVKLLICQVVKRLSMLFKLHFFKHA